MSEVPARARPTQLDLGSGWRRRAVEGSEQVQRAAQKTVEQAENVIAAARILYYETSGAPFTIAQLIEKAGISQQTYPEGVRTAARPQQLLLREFIVAAAAAGELPASAGADSGRLASYITGLMTNQVHSITLGLDQTDPAEPADQLVRFCLAGLGATPR